MVTFFLISQCIFVFFNIIIVNVAQNFHEPSKYVAVPSNLVDKNESYIVEETLRRKIFDDDIGLEDPSSTGYKLASDGRQLSLIKVNKCCPWGTFFDVDTLVCRRPLDSWKMTNDWEQSEIKKKFVTSLIKDYGDVNLYEFETGVPSCNGTKVFVSQVTTDFECDLDGARFEGKPITDEYCIDERRGLGTVLLMCREAREVCRNRPCIRKCKPYGDFFGKEDEGVLDLPPIAVQFYNLNTMKIDTLVKLSHFGLYFGNDCGGRGRQKLSPEDEPNEVHYLGTDGRLYIPDLDNRYFTNEEFCLENVKDENISEVSAFLCFPEPISNLKFYLLAAGFLISCVSLLATFLVYLFSPKSRNLYGKSLMCYVASLFSAYLSLAVIQLDTHEMENDSCIAAGYSVLFFFLAAFFWLNIMSIDIWKTFRSVRLARFKNSAEEKAQFLSYSLYAWSLPCILTGICAAADFTPEFVPPSLKPDFGVQTCWFSKDTKAVYLYFITPISLVIICNTVLYVSTAWRCWKIKSEIIRMGNQSRKKYTANKTQGGHSIPTVPVSLSFFEFSNTLRSSRNSGVTVRSMSDTALENLSLAARARGIYGWEEFEQQQAKETLKLAINGKLFIVMGVVWSLEVISFFFDHPIWYISDAANALHGVFIFVIFVLKKKVLAGLPHGIKKPFIRMKNIKKKSMDDETGDFDDTNASKKFSRSSSTNVTDVSI